MITAKQVQEAKNAAVSAELELKSHISAESRKAVFSILNGVGLDFFPPDVDKKLREIAENMRDGIVRIIESVDLCE